MLTSGNRKKYEGGSSWINENISTKHYTIFPVAASQNDLVLEVIRSKIIGHRTYCENMALNRFECIIGGFESWANWGRKVKSQGHNQTKYGQKGEVYGSP